jgi:uncharacterized protein (TIGR03435 family)
MGRWKASAWRRGMRGARRQSVSQLAALLAVSGAMAAGQDAARPTIVLLPQVHSVRAAHWVAGSIMTIQPNFPAEMTRAYHNDSNWLYLARATSRTAMEITSLRIGWAYALPTGLEFHQTDAITPTGGLSQGGWYETQDLKVAPRADAVYLVNFVEQVTLKNGKVFNADHAQIAAFYKDCCTGPNAGNEPQIPQARVQPDMPGGALPLDWQPTPDLKPIAFDVVSFRRAQQPGTGRVFPPNGDFISYHGSTIHDLLLFGYEGGRQGYFTISGEPDWVKTEFYDFTAKLAPEDVAEWKKMQLIDQRRMVQRVLEDMLKLKVHTDLSDHPVYELQVAKGGPKLTNYHAGDTVTSLDGQARPGKVLGWSGPYNLVGQDVAMADLVNLLSQGDRTGTGRVVIDKTGLTGTYDFSVPVFAGGLLPDQLPQALEDAGVVSVFEGMKQLGLQLVPAKDPVRGIVVDHIERPPEN